MPLTQAKKTPLKKATWDGPSADSPNGGCTFSLISRYLICKERFRVKVIEGISARDTFNHSIEYGSMWHVCEETLAAKPGLPDNMSVPASLKGTKSPDPSLASTRVFVLDNLKLYAQNLCKQYPLEQDQIDFWYNVAKIQFPLYVDYWSKHPDVKERTPLLQEQVFKVPYTLPSGRVVNLRGKWDSVDLIGKGKGAGIYLQENKTKSRVKEENLKRQLGFDAQTMLYIIALSEERRNIGNVRSAMFGSAPGSAQVLGVRYNVVRRTEHRQGKKESRDDFCQRLKGIIEESPHEWFMRWKVEIIPADITKFKNECLDPVLENLCDDYEWWIWCHDRKKNGSFIYRCSPFDYATRAEHFENHQNRHYRYPYGIWNPMDNGVEDDIDGYFNTGSMIGLERTGSLFKELEQ